MFDRIAPRYDLMNRLISLGLDRAWRKRTVRALELAPPSDVVDLACGTGDLCRELTAAGHRAVGVDFAANMLAAAKAGRVPLVRADAVALPLATGAADGLVCGFALRNFADLGVVLAEVARVVRPGGRIALLEVDEPRSRLLALGHAVWFRWVVPRLGALFSDGAAYRYLPRSVAYLPGPDGARRAHRACRVHRGAAPSAPRRDRPDPCRDPGGRATPRRAVPSSRSGRGTRREHAGPAHRS